MYTRDVRRICRDRRADQEMRWHGVTLPPGFTSRDHGHRLFIESGTTVTTVPDEPSL